MMGPRNDVGGTWPNDSQIWMPPFLKLNVERSSVETLTGTSKCCSPGREGLHCVFWLSPLSYSSSFDGSVNPNGKMKKIRLMIHLNILFMWTWILQRILQSPNGNLLLSGSLSQSKENINSVQMVCCKSTWKELIPSTSWYRAQRRNGKRSCNVQARHFSRLCRNTRGDITGRLQKDLIYGKFDPTSYYRTTTSCALHRWKYAAEHDVQLPDEYDQIYHDLEPFWGIEPADLIKIHEESELKKDSYTIGKNETGQVEILTYAFAEGKYVQLIEGTRQILEMFEDIQEHLPPFRMTISPHDNPNRMSDYGVKTVALEAAASQTCQLFRLMTMSLTHFEQISNEPHCQRHST